MVALELLLLFLVFLLLMPVGVVERLVRPGLLVLAAQVAVGMAVYSLVEELMEP